MSGDLTIKGSFRDPSGRVHAHGARILRTVTPAGAPDFEAVLATGFLERLVDEGRLVPFERVTDPQTLALFDDAALVLEHPLLDYVSHPYEWSFPLLKAAALHHLDIALDALEAGIVLSDATAYNIQFDGPRPIFIDHLSFQPYTEGDYWLAHRQFCEQFLNPLLMRAHLGLSHNAWFRGTLEGIPSDHLSAILPARAKLSARMLAHVVLPARMQRKATGQSIARTAELSARRPLPRRAYAGMLGQLRGWIAGLVPKGARTVWGDYAADNTYAATEDRAKAEFIGKFITDTRAETVFDLGCNSGAFSQVALDAGADRVIGFDFDQAALDKAYVRATECGLDYLPLFLDAANPSPSQGWGEAERAGFTTRARADAVLALAFEHHLAIGKNIPLDQVVGWITSLAPTGIIEFIEKDDPTIRAMLALREDIFADYTKARFEEALSARARIVAQAQVTADGRTLYQYDRTAPA